MSSFEENMKDRFSDFEPEVNENTIDQNWQKLKERLPLEEKNVQKKGYFFTLPFMFVCLIIAITGTFLIIYFSDKTTLSDPEQEKLSQKPASNPENLSINNISQENETNQSNLSSQLINLNDSLLANKTLNKKTAESEKTNPSHTSLNYNPSSDNNSTNKKEGSTVISNSMLPDENPVNETTKRNLKSKSFNSTKDTDADKNKNSSDITTKTSNDAFINKSVKHNLKFTNYNSTKTILAGKNKNSSGNNSKVTESLANADKKSKQQSQVPTNNNINHSQTNKELNQKNSSNENVDHLTDPLKNDWAFVYLPIIENYLLPTDTQLHELELPIAIITNTDNIITDPIKKSKVSYELFAGVNWMQNKISSSINSENTDLKNNKLGYSFGGAINYNLSSKLMTQGQFTFNENKIGFEKSTTEMVRISNQTRVMYSPADTANKKDTIIKYFNYNHQYNLKSIYCYNFGLGLSYTLLEKKKLFIGAGVLVNLKLSKYNLERTSHLETDTNQYISNSYVTNDSINSSNTVNLSYTAPEISNSVKNSSVFSVGLTPVITLGYKINEKIALIIRPSYYIDLTKGKTNIDNLKMRINQNNLFIHFGIKLKL